MSDKPIIKTNNQWRQLSYRSEVPENILKSEFDYQDENEVFDGFFKYKGFWYHLDQFMRLDNNSPFGGQWDGYLNDSAFSGVLVKLSDDGDSVKVATFY